MAEPFVSVVNLGCRVNRVESDRISLEFTDRGFAVVDQADADLVVVNTCAVTGEAEAKTRKAVRHALSLPRDPYVVVTGCAANLHPESLSELSSRVVVEPSKVDVVARAQDLLGFYAGGGAEPDQASAMRGLGRSRLGVKIQDGCNNRCTYCIVWKARGPERSVPVEGVLDQVRSISSAGIPEAVLTGVNLGAYAGSYGSDSLIEIDELLSIILDETDIPQVRLSSIEPDDVSERRVGVMSKHPDRVAPFLHLPLQSGCTATLERMGRHYTAREFSELVGMIRGEVPSIALSCDVIVGFPGETDAEFAESLELIEEVGFSRMHVFRYSARPGTLAAEAPDQVAPEVMAERSLAMRELARRMAVADAGRRVGTRENVVLEYGDAGTTGSFHRIRVEGVGAVGPRGLISVDIIGVDDEGSLMGRAIPEPSRPPRT